MAVVRFDPFREMMTLRNAMDRIFEDSLARRLQWGSDAVEGYLPLDMYQTDNEVIVKAALPGVKSEDVDISITGDTLTIKGEQKAEEEVGEEKYFLRERRFGAFSRTIQLPVSIQGDKAEASFEDGVLKLVMPKADEVKPKQIKVKGSPMIEAEKK
ncbi:MAG: Hsp20/alpha crystallin family protein [Dehalococcoidia bacterium]